MVCRLDLSDTRNMVKKLTLKKSNSNETFIKSIYKKIKNEESAFNFAVEVNLISTERKPCEIPEFNGMYFVEKHIVGHGYEGRWRCSKKNCRNVKSLLIRYIILSNP